ncbi:MAG: type II toxin-antitoxin system VapC family toxin [Nitrososphaerales archaeon]
MAALRAVLDTTFFVLHYFSSDPTIQVKSKEILRICRKLGNAGIVPTIVLAEFYVQVAKRAGREQAKMLFNEMRNAGLNIVAMDVSVAEHAATLRHKYHEKIPWGDCIVAASGITNKANFIISEDTHFNEIMEIKARKLASVHV